MYQQIPDWKFDQRYVLLSLSLASPCSDNLSKKSKRSNYPQPSNTDKNRNYEKPIFGLKVEPHGRLNLIKDVTIQFQKYLDNWDRFFDDYISTYESFFDARVHERFPALEKLCLDFKMLNLKENGIGVGHRDYVTVGLPFC